MGVKTAISLASLNALFPKYNFINIKATTNGVVDTTYLASSISQTYILKKYERDIKLTSSHALHGNSQLQVSNEATQTYVPKKYKQNIDEKIQEDIKLLASLKTNGLNVPLFLDENEGWFIYEKLDGEVPKSIQTYHIQALARFTAKMHKVTYKKDCKNDFYGSYEVKKLLASLKIKHYHYYKKLSSLASYKPTNDGIIHGDIFKDNTVFDEKKIGVFDFIDAGNGSFVFECAVSIIAFGVKKNNEYLINIYLNTYNQNAPKKINKKELLKHLSIARKFYALLRIMHHKSTKKARELL